MRVLCVSCACPKYVPRKGQNDHDSGVGTATKNDDDARAFAGDVADSGYWWHDENPHQLLPVVANAIDSDGNFSAKILHCYGLYLGRPMLGTAPTTYSATTPASNLGPGPDLSLSDYDGAPITATNVVHRIVSTLVAEVAQNQPRPMFLTDAGSYALQQAAKKMTRFCDGCFAESDADKVMKTCGRDALVASKGIAKIVEDGGRVRVERVFPGHFLVDDQDAINGKPRSVYQRMYVDRGKLAAMYPDSRDEIMRAPRSADSTGVGYRSASDQVEVFEGWHLPSQAANVTTGAKASDDGRHAIVILGCTLFDEPWEDDSFPFAWLDWEAPALGFWSQGIAEILTGIQARLLELDQRIQEAQELAALRIFVQKGSGVTAGHFDGIDGTIVQYDGQQPPIFNTAPVVVPELYAERERLIRQAFDECGVSEMAAQALKPAGIDSGEALRTYIDHQSKRFLDFEQAYERFAVDIAKQMIALARRLAADDKSYEVVYRGKGGIERIKWSEIDLAADAYHIDVPPVSALPKTPSGRLAAIQSYLQSGLTQALGWNADVIRSLLNFPDLDAVQPTTPTESAQADVASILDRGVYVAPEEFQDLATCIKVAQDTYLDVRRKGAPESVKELLLQYIDDAQGLLDKAKAAAAPPPPMMPGAPPAPAGPPGMGMPPGVLLPPQALAPAA